MKTLLRSTAVASLLTAVSCAVFAADSVELSIKGVIRPAACNADLSGGAVADFGTISARSLSPTAATVLPAKVITLTVSCDAATKVGITTIDNRAGTINDAASTALIGTPGYTFGVGSVAGKGIGAYTLMMGPNEGMQATADGNQVVSIYSQDAGATWISSLQGPAQPGVRTQSWAPVGTTTPGAYKLVTQPIKVTMAIGKTGDLPPLTEEMAIDGLTTISIKYL